MHISKASSRFMNCRHRTLRLQHHQVQDNFHLCPEIRRLSPRSPRQSVSRAISDRDSRARKTSAGLITITTSSDSKKTGNDSDNDDDGEDYYVSTPLEPQTHDEETLRKHLQSHRWSRFGAKVQETVVDNPARMLQQPRIAIRKGPSDDRSHYRHCQVFDVRPDGAPLPIDLQLVERESSRLMLSGTLSKI